MSPATNDTQVTPQADTSDIFGQIAEKIIEQQVAIIGPIAVEQAERINNLTVDWSNHTVGVKGDPKTAIDDLVGQYKELFGQIAVETCKEAAATYLAKLSEDQLPASLK